MLVEINLLPIKKTKNRAIIVMVFLLFIIALVCASIVYSQYRAITLEKETLTQELSTLEKMREIQEQKISTNDDANSVIKLEQTVNWADEYFVETVPVIKHLSSMLPERGFVQSFTYVEAGIVSLIVQFDTNTEVAHYLATLNDSEYIKTTKLNSITTTPLEEEQTETTDPVIGPPTEETEVTKDYVPRYVAQFELTFNKDQLKILQKEGN